MGRWFFTDTFTVLVWPGAKAGKYLGVFTALNLVFLVILYMLAKLGV